MLCYQSQINVVISEPYSRVTSELSLDKYVNEKLPNLNHDLKSKFGKAVGESLASNLDLIFDKIEPKNEGQ